MRLLLILLLVPVFMMNPLVAYPLLVGALLASAADS